MASFILAEKTTGERVVETFLLLPLARIRLAQMEADLSFEDGFLVNLLEPPVLDSHFDRHYGRFLQNIIQGEPNE